MARWTYGVGIRTVIAVGRTTRSLRLGMLLLVSAAFLGLLGCQSATESVPESSVPDTYVAISGGGWRAHTAQAAWTMGLLEGYRAGSPDSASVDLSTVFEDVHGIASNSGGSWFSTMLAYSQDFRASIEAPGALSTYGSTGYLGQQRTALSDPSCTYKGAGCGTSRPLSCFECNVIRLTDHQYTVWTNIVEDVVFLPYGMAQDLGNKPLSGERQAWAEDKSLVFAATMLTDNVVTNQDDCGYVYCNEIFYQVTSQLRPDVPQQVSVTPVAFASLPAATRLGAPDFFLAGDMQVKYASNASSGGPPSGNATISNGGLNSDVSVLMTAATSSAAAGAQASEAVESYQEAVAPWTDAYNASGLAPGFKIEQGSLTPASPTQNTKPATLAADRFIRLADGGFLDNSAVSHVVNFLQKNSAPSFNIIAFDNVQQSYQPPGLPGMKVPVDIAYLFGKGPPNVPPSNPKTFDPTVFCGGKFLFWNLCLPVPKQQIFEPNPVETTKASWTYPCGTNEVSYTKYTVTTVDNPTLGVSPGTTGTLHVFAAIFPKADTTPNADQADWDEYQRMLTCISEGMGQNGGVDWFRKALVSSE